MVVDEPSADFLGPDPRGGDQVQIRSSCSWSSPPPSSRCSTTAARSPCSSWRPGVARPADGLPNRILFRSRLDASLTPGSMPAGGVALLFCDLDGFKQVNDGYGHAAGDELLVAVGERLRSCVRETDLVARIGGDEFTVPPGRRRGTPRRETERRARRWPAA